MRVGQFDETPLDNFLSAMDKLANSIAIISRTPKHYFYGGGSNVSGEALLAMESPLTKKVQQHQANFEPTWLELGAFLFKLMGKDIPASEIQVAWAPAESIQPYTEAQTLNTLTQAGLPIITAARWSGKTQGEIDAMLEDIAKARSKQAIIYRRRCWPKRVRIRPTATRRRTATCRRATRTRRSRKVEIWQQKANRPKRKHRWRHPSQRMKRS